MVFAKLCLSVFLLTTLFCVTLSHSGENVDEAGLNNAVQKVTFALDFSDYQGGPVDKWLEMKGFQFKRDARNRNKLNLEASDNGLILDTKSPILGVVVNEKVDLEDFTSIRLEWGVLDYPEGASYENGIRNEALMVIVFFGHEKMPSGHLLIPNSPYFIGFFLGREEKAGKSYTGRYFKKSGRYVCLGNPEEGKTIISQYDLVDAFKRKYGKDTVPLISGIALTVDTTKARNRGMAKALIKTIEFLE